MFLNELDAKTRLESPLNLLNQLNKLTRTKNDALSIFKPSEVIDTDSEEINEEDSELSTVIDEQKLKRGLVKANALDVQYKALKSLSEVVEQVAKPKDLALIADRMSHILNDGEETSKKNINQIVIFKPATYNLNQYETVIANE